MDETAQIHAQSRPRLPRGVRLKRDEARNRWTLLAPERIDLAALPETLVHKPVRPARDTSVEASGS